MGSRPAPPWAELSAPHLLSMNSSTAVMLWLGKWELTEQRKGWGWEGASQDTFPGCALARDVQQGSALGSPPRINAREIDCYKVCALPPHPSGREKGVPAFCGPRKKEEQKGHLGQEKTLTKKWGSHSCERFGGTGTEGLRGKVGCAGVRRSEGSVPQVVGGLAWCLPVCVSSPSLATPAYPCQYPAPGHRQPHPASSSSGTLSQPPPPLPSGSSRLNPPGVQASHPEVLPAPRTLLPPPLLPLVFYPALALQSCRGAQNFGPEVIPTPRTWIHGGTVLGSLMPTLLKVLKARLALRQGVSQKGAGRFGRESVCAHPSQ